MELVALIRRLDTRSSTAESTAWSMVAPFGESAVEPMTHAYPSFKTWQGRASLIYHSLPYARVNESAFKLGLVAATDRAKVVRYRAISLLAYSLRNEALAVLHQLLTHPHSDTAQDAAAAIDAIKCQCHHYFHDRTHSGKLKWKVHGAEPPR